MLRDLKSCLIVRLSKDVFSLPCVRQRLCTSVIMGWGGGSRGRSWVSWAALATRRRRRMRRQTSTCSPVSLQIVGMDLWLGQLQAGSITQFPLQGSLPVLPCSIMEFYGIAALLRGKTLLCSPCLNHSGIPGHRSVGMLMCLGRCGWGIFAGWTCLRRDWGCSCWGLIQVPQSRGIPPALAVGSGDVQPGVFIRGGFKKG